MEYLKVPPEKMYRRFRPIQNEYHSSSLDMLSPYLDISPFTDYISSLEDFRLKNIWNAVVIQWTRIHYELSDNKSFKRSPYSKQNYSQIHTTFEMSKALFVKQKLLSIRFKGRQLTLQSLVTIQVRMSLYCVSEGLCNFLCSSGVTSIM